MTAPSESVEFRWFEHRVRVEAADRRLLDDLHHRWGQAPSSTDRPAETLDFRIREGDGSSPVLDTPDGAIPLDPAQPALHAYTVIVTALFGAVDRHFVFHATAVAGDDGMVLVSGPSGFGKSTLGIHLALGGFGWVADDVSILDRETHVVHPFDRPVRLRPGTRALLPAGVLRSAEAARIVEDGDDWIVPPGRWLPQRSDSAPVRVVALLRSAGSESSIRRFPLHTIRLRPDRSALASELLVLSGIEHAEANARDPLRIDLRVKDPAALVAWLDEHPLDVVFSIKSIPAPERFDGEPSLAPITRFQAALELSQEMLNRHASGALGREYAGRAADLVGDVAVALGHARCFAVTPGRIDDTVRLIREAYDTASTGT